MARSADPARDIARLALNFTPDSHGDLLIATINYCWDQLSWRRTEAELHSALDHLRAQLDDDARAAAQEANDRARMVNVGGHRDGGSAS